MGGVWEGGEWAKAGAPGEEPAFPATGFRRPEGTEGVVRCVAGVSVLGRIRQMENSLHPGSSLLLSRRRKAALLAGGQWRSGFTLVGIAGVFRILDSRKTEATRT